MNITTLTRLTKAYKIIGNTFGTWFAPIITGILVIIIRILVTAGRILDHIFFPNAFIKPITKPIMIVGNPRSGTTFIHRYLVDSKIGTGNQLWQMLYPSIILQKIFKPLLPFLEKISPARHHSTAAHATNLQSVETDDVAIFFRFLDGFFLYGFVLSWAEEDLFKWMDPKIRNMGDRDYAWLESLWIRNQYSAGTDRIIGKLFSLSTNLPQFLDKYPDSKILYIVRDPLAVIPSGLNLVSGVLDKRFGFWNLPIEKRQHFVNRLYFGLVHLLKRFHEDWENGRIDKSKVYIVQFDRMMNDFDTLMEEILAFIGHEPSEDLLNDIQETAEKQRKFKSGHKYDLEKFGLTEEQIRLDCAPIYETFLEKDSNK